MLNVSFALAFNNLVLNGNDKKRNINYDSNQKFLEIKKVEEIEDVQEKEEIN